MTYVICKNEVERFEQMGNNYDGNLPTILKELFYSLVITGGNRLPMRQLDYGAHGVSLTKQQVVDALQYKLDNDRLLPWHIDHCKETIAFIQNHEEDSFMYVVYER